MIQAQADTRIVESQLKVAESRIVRLESDRTKVMEREDARVEAYKEAEAIWQKERERFERELIGMRELRDESERDVDERRGVDKLEHQNEILQAQIVNLQGSVEALTRELGSSDEELSKSRERLDELESINSTLLAQLSVKSASRGDENDIVREELKRT